ELTRDGVLQKLAPREFMLLEFFLRHPGRVFTPEQLLNSVWSADDHVGPEVVRTSINRIRKQLDKEGDDSIITNVYGVGYKLKD
ncbi:MAG TPA: helix-turn-helix domain-containing protein, partial [Candidatus Melainabacteria bacterium]|nr:helix-turn-helix domain-containing protein [Candidatus Melainabacteria bacterium]